MPQLVFAKVLQNGSNNVIFSVFQDYFMSQFKHFHFISLKGIHIYDYILNLIKYDYDLI
jgi:hypothetical protein